MNEKINFEIYKENLDTINMLSDALPWKDGEKLNQNEVLKVVLWTFLAFIKWWEDNSDLDWKWCDWHNKWWCGCN